MAKDKIGTAEAMGSAHVTSTWRRKLRKGSLQEKATIVLSTLHRKICFK